MQACSLLPYQKCVTIGWARLSTNLPNCTQDVRDVLHGSLKEKGKINLGNIGRKLSYNFCLLTE